MILLRDGFGKNHPQLLNLKRGIKFIGFGGTSPAVG
jgi:hypothetical protein